MKHKKKKIQLQTLKAFLPVFNPVEAESPLIFLEISEIFLGRSKETLPVG